MRILQKIGHLMCLLWTLNKWSLSIVCNWVQHLVKHKLMCWTSLCTVNFCLHLLDSFSFHQFFKLHMSGSVATPHHIRLLCCTNRHSKSERYPAGAGTPGGSRVPCVQGTSISRHLHTSPPPTLQRESGKLLHSASCVWVCVWWWWVRVSLRGKERCFPTISIDSFPPPPSFWSSTVAPLQSPP